MKFAHAFALLLAAFAPVALGQDEIIKLDSEHNITSLEGLWASGAGNVLTGDGFAQPAKLAFTYPKTSGVSYSFTNDGFMEVARYRFVSNASQPTCITGVIGWAHGKYEIAQNGSITFHPFGDGYQQIQEPCGAISNFIEDYNKTELYSSFRIYYDSVVGVYKLHLFNFDGSPVAPLFRISEQPNMLPTQKLRNASGMVTGKSKRDLEESSSGASSAVVAPTALAATLLGAAVMAFAF